MNKADIIYNKMVKLAERLNQLMEEGYILIDEEDDIVRGVGTVNRKLNNITQF